MGISAKTRKLLWGKSGNRCAICRRPLVADRTTRDPDALIGDECHIISGASAGPRSRKDFAADYDSYDNLILLCKNDHKRVDDQPGEYTAERLRATKAKHEKWVATRLGQRWPPKASILRQATEREVRLEPVFNGRDLLRISMGSCACEFYNPELDKQEEVDLVGGFFEYLQDCDVLNEIGPSMRVQAEYDLTGMLEELRAVGFVVCAARVNRTLRVDDEDTPWPVSIVRVLRHDIEELARQVNQQNDQKEPSEPNGSL